MEKIKKIIPEKVKIFFIKTFSRMRRPSITVSGQVSECLCCGSISLMEKPILWDQLIQDWQLSEREVAYINRQQGLYCQRCKVNLRGMAIAYGMMKYENYRGYFKYFVGTGKMRSKQILEINEAAWLTQYFSSIPGHVLANFPEVDMQNMPYPDCSFDIVVHSDTLEHVPDPLAGLRECHRILAPGGYCVFTVPIVVGRLTRSRAGMPTSFHGSEGKSSTDYIVHTEFGADAWTLVAEAGFSNVSEYCLEYPAAVSFLCMK